MEEDYRAATALETIKSLCHMVEKRLAFRMQSRREIQNLALIGFMGTGKSSIGRLVADRLQFEFLDTDTCIETRAGKSISRIFAEDGEAAFRAHEQAVVEDLAGRRRLVIATGGGLGADPAHLASLRAHAWIVCLCASPEIIWERTRHHDHRPLLQAPDPLTRIRELLTRRQPVYRQADLLVSTDFRSPHEVAQILVSQFRHECRTAAAS
jgi:shikimate kinase